LVEGRSVEEGKRLLLAGPKLSGEIPEEVEADSERSPDWVGARPKGRVGGG
jgi:hypothetical protein